MQYGTTRAEKFLSMAVNGGWVDRYSTELYRKAIAAGATCKDAVRYANGENISAMSTRPWIDYV